MNKFEEGLKLVEEKFGNGRDNIIALATIACEPGAEDKPRPVVREVDAYYENGVFYITTYAGSNKMKQIAANPEVSILVSSEWFTAAGTGENLGWVLKPENAGIRDRLRTAFVKWYDMANNENDENCVILAAHLTRGTLNINHWEKLYHLDFVNQTDMEDGGVFQAARQEAEES